MTMVNHDYEICKDDADKNNHRHDDIFVHTNATRMLIGVVCADTYKSDAFALLFV